METKRARIFIVDDHPIVIKSLEFLINAQANLYVCGWAATAREALRQLESCSAELVIVDISLPDRHGLDLVRDVRAFYSRIRILVVSAHNEEIYAVHALNAGANGYVMKDADIGILTGSIQQVLAGHTYLSPNMLARLWEYRRVNGIGADTFTRLSERELQVLELLGKGRTVIQISEALSLGRHSVETYQTRLREKLAMENTHELLRYAVLWSVSENSGNCSHVNSDVFHLNRDRI